MFHYIEEASVTAPPTSGFNACLDIIDASALESWMGALHQPKLKPFENFSSSGFIIVTVILMHQRTFGCSSTFTKTPHI